MRKFIFAFFSTFAFYSSFTFANVISNGFQNFNPAPDGLDFVTVQSSQTLRAGDVNIGMFLNEAYNSLPYFEDPTTQSRTRLNDSLLGSDFNVGIGLPSHWEFTFSAPAILKQTIDSTAPFHGAYEQTGNTEIRVAAKHRFSGDDSGGLAGIFTATLNETENNPYVGSGAGPILNFEIAKDKTFNSWRAAFNIGYRHPQRGSQVANFPIVPIEDQMIASVAASRLLSNFNTKMIFETFGSLPVHTTSSNTDRSASSLEFLAGLKHDFNTHLAVHIGAGTQLINGVSSPDWRWYTGLNYSFGPLFAKPTSPLVSDVGDSAQNIEKITVGSVLFEFDSDNLSPQFTQFLDDLAARIHAMANFRKLQVIGHTDSIGDHDYNMALSQRRADTIKQYLIKKGLDGSKIEAIGKGEMEPIADNGNFQGRQKNRRVEFIIESRSN